MNLIKKIKAIPYWLKGGSVGVIIVIFYRLISLLLILVKNRNLLFDFLIILVSPITGPAAILEIILTTSLANTYGADNQFLFYKKNSVFKTITPSLTTAGQVVVTVILLVLYFILGVLIAVFIRRLINFMRVNKK